VEHPPKQAAPPDPAPGPDQQERRDLADQYAYYHDEDGAAERRALADQYAQAQGSPAEGSEQGIVDSILALFQQPQATAPTGPGASPTPFGELIAPVLALFPRSENAEDTRKN